MESVQGTAFRYFGWERLPLHSGKADLLSRQMSGSAGWFFFNSFAQTK